jgi:hypothetical protein
VGVPPSWDLAPKYGGKISPIQAVTDFRRNARSCSGGHGLPLHPGGAEQASFESVRGGSWTTSLGEGLGDPPRAGAFRHRFADLVTQPIGTQAIGGQARAGAGHLYAPGDLQLVAAEGHDTHRDAVRKRLLGGAHPAVGHRANCPFEQTSVWDEPFHACVGWDMEGCVVAVRGERCHDAQRLVRKRLEGHLDEAGVVLEFRRRRDEDDRILQFRQPPRRI